MLAAPKAELAVCKWTFSLPARTLSLAPAPGEPPTSVEKQAGALTTVVQDGKDGLKPKGGYLWLVAHWTSARQRKIGRPPMKTRLDFSQQGMVLSPWSTPSLNTESLKPDLPSHCRLNRGCPFPGLSMNPKNRRSQLQSVPWKTGRYYPESPLNNPPIKQFKNNTDHRRQISVCFYCGSRGAALNIAGCGEWRGLGTYPL